MEEIVVGLINGRHEMPVDEYMFDKIDNPLNFKGISDRVSEFICERVGIKTEQFGSCINSIDYTDIQHFAGKRHLVVYVTGLTPVVAEVIRQCACNGVKLTLMHYDSVSQIYVPQKIF